MIWFKSVLSFIVVALACWLWPEFAVPLFLGLTGALEAARSHLGAKRIAEEEKRLDYPISFEVEESHP